MSEFLISNPYLGLSFLISLYLVGYFTISKVASRILIDRSNGIAREPSRFFKFSEFFLDLAGLIIVQVILDKSLIIELGLGFLLNLLMKPLMSALSLITMSKKDRDQLLQKKKDDMQKIIDEIDDDDIWKEWYICIVKNVINILDGSM